MADPAPVSEPDPAPATEPGPAVPPGQTAPPPAPPSKTKPVVLATPLLHEFVIPAGGEDGADLVITASGVALSRKQADHVEQVAAASGVQLRDITPAPEKD
jgi:hypothetical protein